MLLSFPMSFYYSRLAVTDKARASMYVWKNLFMSSFCMAFFAFSLYRKNQLQKDHSQKYLWMLSNEDL
jgi:hypothetical protein